MLAGITAGKVTHMTTRAKDLTGNRYGRWEVLYRAGSDAYDNAYWFCVCDCGTERRVKARLLNNGQSTSCGCRKTEVAASRYIDLSGKIFGEWSVIKIGKTDSKEGRWWWCRCSCGTKRQVKGKSLRAGVSKSCGCKQNGHITHGMSKSPEHNAWKSIWQRCTNPTTTKWHLYGGRGIQVCDEWVKFENFFADMGPRPSPEHSIDRIDGDGNYEPGNCRWATIFEQNNNTSRNKRIKRK